MLLDATEEWDALLRWNITVLVGQYVVNGWVRSPPGRINSSFLMGVSLTLEEESILSCRRILQLAFFHAGNFFRAELFSHAVRLSA
jgi:hypothetical protein